MTLILNQRVHLRFMEMLSESHCIECTKLKTQIRLMFLGSILTPL